MAEPLIRRRFTPEQLDALRTEALAKREEVRAAMFRQIDTLVALAAHDLEGALLLGSDLADFWMLSMDEAVRGVLAHLLGDEVANSARPPRSLQ